MTEPTEEELLASIKRDLVLITPPETMAYVAACKALAAGRLSPPAAAGGLLTPAQLAARWQTSVTTIQREIRRQKLPAVKVGRQSRIRMSDVLERENPSSQRLERVVRQRRRLRPVFDHIGDV